MHRNARADGYAALATAESLRAVPASPVASETGPAFLATTKDRIGAGNPLAEQWLPQIEVIGTPASAPPVPPPLPRPIPLPPPLRHVVKPAAHRANR